MRVPSHRMMSTGAGPVTIGGSGLATAASSPVPETVSDQASGAASDPVMHPQAQARLAAIVASGEAPLETLPPIEARAIADARVRGGGMASPSLAKVADLSCPGPAGGIPLRLFRATSSGRLPLVLFFHGGGFMVGNLDTHDALCRQIADGSGACVVSVGYRLAPEHRFPAAPDDCLAAARWVLEQGDLLDIDTGSVALAGESSGGTMVAVVAQAFAAAGLPAPRLQVMIYPMLDASTDGASYERFAQGYFFTRRKARYFIDHYLRDSRDAADPRASPLRAATLEGQPPALIITAGLDPMLSEAENYADRLRAAGVEVDYRCFDGWPHGFLFWGGAEAAGEAMTLVCDALASRLAPAPRTLP